MVLAVGVYVFSRALARALVPCGVASRVSSVAEVTQVTVNGRAEQSHQDGHGVDGSFLEGLCHSAAQTSGIASVTIVVSGQTNPEGAVAHSDVAASEAHALEFTLGEGPTTDALTAALPTLACDLETALQRWPQFIPAVLQLRIGSISAVPLRVGAIRFGNAE